MRSALLASTVLCIATPALAAQPPIGDEMGGMAQTLNDPATQDAAAAAVDATADAMLDVRIDGLAKALAPLNHGRPVNMHGRTLRDLAERDDPEFENRLHDGTRGAIGSMGALASAVAVMLPELEAAARKMRDALPEMH